VQRARQPQFPVGIQPRTFELVDDTLKQLNYTGPLGLSCDDTKLLASFRPYYDEEKKGYFVMGHVGEPFQVIDPASFQHAVDEKQLKKATKVKFLSIGRILICYSLNLLIQQLCLFCLQVPIPKIATIIVAALGILDNLSANKLFKYLWEILTGLLDRKIQVSSYAADGSTVERSVQDLLQQRASRTTELRITHPADDGMTHDDIIIPIF